MKNWDAPTAESSELEREYARAWQGTPKVVFSTTLESVGPNARLVKEKADVERTVRQLKAGSKSSKAASVSDRQTPHLNRCSWQVSLFGEQHELSVGLPNGFYAQSTVRAGFGPAVLEA
jgi:outer membrane receptor for ferric coprogen and ferric-rhodotorulic acid